MGVLLQEPLDVQADPLPAPRRRKGLGQCCCGCSLQAGCIVIGTLSFINGISALFLSLKALVFEGQSPFDDSVRNGLMLLYGALHLTSGLCLIYGADKRRPSFMKFWLFTRYVEFAFTVGAAAYFFIMTLTHGVSSGVIMVAFTYFAIIIGIFMYCIAVVHGFCREITDSRNIQSLKEAI